MKLLLDTHCFIWWDSEPDRLSQRALALCEDPENELTLSVASLWEIQIKEQLGKIKLRAPVRQLVAGQQESNGMRLLPIHAHHVFEIGALPQIHRDPFDRLLVAQARVEGLSVVSHDAVMREYPIVVEW